MENTGITISTIVEDYVNHKLAKEGLNFHTTNTPSSTDRKLGNTILRVCDEFETRFNDQFSHLTDEQSSHLDNFDKNSYYEIMRNITEGGINWGRVVALVTFVGKMAVMAAQYGAYNKVDQFVDWTVAFMEDNVQPWILRNGLLEGFMKFFSAEDPVEFPQSSPWGIVAVTSLSIVGLAALGALVVQHT